MNTRILFLPADPAAEATLIELDGSGRVHARSVLAPGTTAAPPSAPTHTVLVVPGACVRIDALELEAHSDAQARAAAQALLPDRLARPGPLHVALDANTQARRLVAALDPAVLRTWLERAAGFGIAPDAAVPEQLLLDAPGDGEAVHVVDAGDRWLVRGQGLAFVAEPALALQVIGQRRRIPLDGGLDALAARTRAPEVDLLQGDFLPAAKRTRPASRRRLAWLAAALLASPLLLVGAQALRLELAARTLEARAVDAIRTALPAAATADASTTAELLQAAREPQGFTAASAALFATVASVPGTHLLELEYHRGDRLRAVLFHTGAGDIDTLRATLAAEGWRLVEGGSSDTPGGLRTGLTLEPEA